AEDTPTEGPCVWLRVTDTGCGMAPELRERIFDPFFSTKFIGRGLGLSAVLGIVRGHHGALVVQSEPARGSAFEVHLPVPPAPVPDPALAETVRLASAPAVRTVLVIEDEVTV